MAAATGNDQSRRTLVLFEHPGIHSAKPSSRSPAGRLLRFCCSTNARPAAQLYRGARLVFNALAISSISIDWYLSLEAPFNSSSFGATIAIASLAAALAWAALCRAASGRRSRARRSRRPAARDAAWPDLHELHGRAGHLVRRSSRRIRLVCRAHRISLAAVCVGGLCPRFVAPDLRSHAVEDPQRPRGAARRSAAAC